MSTRRRVEFELVGTGSNIEAILNRVTAGINRVGGAGRQTQHELGLIDKQLLAISTTIRYAFAGSMVFGITGAIGRLTEFGNKLGQVAALAGDVSGGRYNAPSQGVLGDIGSQAILESNKLGIAVGDIQDYMTRFYSSFDVSRGRAGMDQMRSYVDQVARLQQALGAEAGDPQMLGGGIAGLVNQIPGGRRNIGKTTNRVSNLIWTLLSETPNITGRDVARDIGRIGSTMAIANMTPEEAFAVWTAAGRSGGSSSVIGRGITQLLGSSLLHPNTPDQLRAFGQAGLPTDPTTLRNMGGFAVLQQMLRAVAPNGASIRNRGILGSEEVGDEDALAGAGISGVNLTLLYNLLGRQESVRQFINLIANDGVEGLRNFNDMMKRNVRDDVGRAREEAALRQRALQRLGTSAGNIPMAILRDPLNAAAGAALPAVEGASSFLAGHRTTTDVATGAIGLALGAYGARRFARTFGKLRRAGRGGLGGAAGEAAGAAITAEQLPSLLGGDVPDGSRGRPFWVMISPASWMVGQPGGFSSQNPNLTDKSPGGLWNKLKTVGGWGAAAASQASRLGRGALGRGAALGGLLAAEAPALPDIISMLSGGDPFNYGRYDKYPSLKRAWNQDSTGARGSIVDQVYKGMIGAPRAEALLKLLDSRRGQGVSDAIFGHTSGSMDVTVRLVDSQGRTIATQKKGGVPVKFYGQNAPVTSGGNTGTRRRGK